MLAWFAPCMFARNSIPRGLTLQLIYLLSYLLTYLLTHSLHGAKSSLRSWQLSLWLFLNTIHFYGEKLLAPRQTPKLEDHPLSAVHDCLFYISAATLHIGGHSSIRNLRTCHAMMTGTHLPWTAIDLEASNTLLVSCPVHCAVEKWAVVRTRFVWNNWSGGVLQLAL
jgi:hypothetical protein